MSIAKRELLSVRMGTSANFATLAGSLYSDGLDRSDSSSTGGGTPVDLASFVVPANALLIVGDQLRVFASGTKPTNVAVTSLTLAFLYGGNTIVSTTFSSVTQFDWQLQIYFVVSVAGASGTLKYAYQFSEIISNSVASGTRFGNGSTSIDLTADQTAKMTSLAVGTGATPWATEYTMLCDYISVPL